MHDRISVNAVSFPGEPFEDVVDHWRELEPHRVSLANEHVLGDALPAARGALAATSYSVETIAHAFLWGRPLSDEVAWDGARATMGELIDAAEVLGARSIYVLTGGRGTLTWEQAAECFAAAIEPCVARARDVGVALLIEPALPFYADVHIAHSLRDTVRVAELTGIGVCLDIFHCWTEARLKETIDQAISRCELVQVSDYVLGDRSLPCRAVPGDGTIPLEQILGWVLDAGYAGAFDLELLGPRIDKLGRVEAAGRAASRVAEILDARVA